MPFFGIRALMVLVLRSNIRVRSKSSRLFFRKPGGFQWSALAWGFLGSSYACVVSIVLSNKWSHVGALIILIFKNFNYIEVIFKMCNCLNFCHRLSLISSFQGVFWKCRSPCRSDSYSLNFILKFLMYFLCKIIAGKYMFISHSLVECIITFNVIV